MRCLPLMFAGMLLAQGPVRRPPLPRGMLDISGHVVDADTAQPLEGAAVTIRCMDDRFREQALTRLTPFNGTFQTRMHAEQGCSVSVLAEGYVQSREDAGRGPVRIPPDNAAAVRNLRFALHREAEVSGTMIDRATERPVAGLTVWAQWSEFERGKRKLRAAADAASTDAEGRFRLKRLPPGKYFLQVMQPEQERIEGRARAAEKLTGYARAFWPDGAHEAAVPLWVYAGARLDAGALLVEKRPFYRAHAVIRTPLCAAWRKYRTVLWQRQGPEFVARANDVLSCGAPFTVHNLTAGSWWLEARLEGALVAEADSVLELLEVRDKDLAVELQPLPSLKVQMKITGRGAGELSSGEAALIPAGGPVCALPLPEKIERGSAVLAAPASEKAELRLLKLDSKLAVAGIRYNRGTADDGVFAPNRSAPSQLLEVEITDRPATLAGFVKDGERSLAGALVVAAPWPSALRADWPRTQRTLASPEGAYAFTNLAPGEYRVFAIDAGLRAKLEEPGVLLRLIGNGETAELGEGGRARLDVKPVEP